MCLELQSVQNVPYLLMDELIMQHRGKTLEQTTETRRLLQSHNALLLEMLTGDGHHTILVERVWTEVNQNHILKMKVKRQCW